MDNRTHASDSTRTIGLVMRKTAALLLTALMLVAAALPPLTITAEAAAGNYTGRVFSASITSDDNATYLQLNANQRLTFNFSYNRTEVRIRMNQTASVPEFVSMTANPIFSSARWVGNTLVLTLNRRDGFMGYRAQYDENNNIMVRFRNPPSSMHVTRVVIDPGHGGRDRGAEGFNRDMPESVINQHMSRFLAEELRARGATVLVLDTFTHGMELSERVRQAEQFNADFLISVHNNASRNASATGTEVFFFTPFSNVLAATTSRNVSQQLNTINRRGRRARFAVTRSTQFQSILVEAGFMTNRAEHDKLITPHYQRAVAIGIADAIESVVAHSYPGTGRRIS